MSGCSGLDRTALQSITVYAPHIRVLNLSLWQTLKGDDLQLLTELANLEELYLIDCKGIKE